MDFGIVRRALSDGKIRIDAVDIRDFAEDKHQMTDDRPYGGGAGMVMKPEPLAGAIRSAQGKAKKIGANKIKTVLMSPQGRVFDQWMARELAREDALIIVCGRYEGPDERICANFIDDEISMGDFVLSGGEPAAMLVIDAVSRLIPGVLGDSDSAVSDSFSKHLIEHGHYTRPPVFEGEKVPDVLLSGNHEDIATWRIETSLIRTFLKRPDLLSADLKPPGSSGKDGKKKTVNTVGDLLRLSEEEISILKKWTKKLESIIRAHSIK